MTSASFQCEYMRNAFPAKELRLRGNFYAVGDANGEHMIFTMDDAGNLNLTMKGSQGHNELINLNKRFNLADNMKVTTFAASQNKDGRIFLVFAARQGTDADKLFVVRSLSPTSHAWSRAYKKEDLYTGEQSDIHIRDIDLATSNYASTSTDSMLEYPQIYITFKHRKLTTEDIWALTVDSKTATWRNRGQFAMPSNPSQIVAKCPANIGDYRGLYVLYREVAPSASPLQMRFVGIDPTVANPNLISRRISVPKGTRTIAAFENEQGLSDLLIGGESLSWLPVDALFEGDVAFPKTMATGDTSAYVNVKKMLIAQDDEYLSLWSLKDDGRLYYQELTIGQSSSEPTQLTEQIPLETPTSKNVNFAAMQNMLVGQKLFVTDDNNALFMLEQDPYTALWREPVEVAIRQDAELLEFDSYTIRFQLTNTLKNEPVRLGQFRLKCSTTAEMIVNGESQRGSPEGVLVVTDYSGAITVIIRSDENLASPLLTLDQWTTTDSSLSKPLQVDPTSKLWSKLDSVRNAEDLRAAKLPDGSALVDVSTKQEDVVKVAEAIQKLKLARVDLAGSMPSAPVLPSGNVPKPGVAQRIWGFFRTIGNKLKSAAEWVVEKVGSAWRFVTRIAGKVWTFVLETVQHVTAAVQKILQTIANGAKKVWEYVKFLFNWNDILDTKNIIVNVTNQALLFGVDSINALEQKSEVYFEGIKSKMRALRKMQLPPELSGGQLGKQPPLLPEEKNKPASASDSFAKQEELRQSPQASYGTYHLAHSGGIPKSSGNTPLSRIMDRFTGVFKEMESLVQHLVTNFGQFFKSTNVSIKSLFEKLTGDLLEDLIEVIEKLVSLILGAFAELMLYAIDGINKTIQIPVLSALYKKISGNNLTILDAIALVLAIPVTFAFKISSGKRPSEIKDIGPLILPNAMKLEIDALMGRLKEKSKPVAPTPQVFMQMAASASTAPGKMISDDDRTRASLKANAKRFAKSSSTAASIFKIGVPIGAHLWFQAVTFPALFLPQRQPQPTADLISYCIDTVIWAPGLLGFVDPTQDFDQMWDNDPYFRHRFSMWAVSFVPVMMDLAGPSVATLTRLVIEPVKMAMLAFLQIESWTYKEGYSLYLAFEEWFTTGSNMAEHIAGNLRGRDEFISTLVTFALRQVAFGMKVARLCLEETGQRKILFTGMQLA